VTSIALVSGGLDSAVLLWLFRPSGAVTFNYGQKNEFKEVFYAEKMCKELNIRHKILDISSSFDEIESGLLKGKLTDAASSIVPNRNLIMLSIVSAWAATANVNVVLIGTHKTDAPAYPDCTKEFISGAEQMLRVSLNSPLFSISAPFIDKEKHEIIKMGQELNVPFEMTWSCYRDGSKHCGVCPACQVRKEGFEKSGVEDPTEYEV
jgi:7-cyano-7-deazaguanine synthase